MRFAEESVPWLESCGDDGAEFSRLVAISLLGVSPQASSSFIPESGETLERDWLLWSEGFFGGIIGPIFCEAYGYGSRHEFREVAALDREFGFEFPDVSSALVDAAQPFVEGKEEMRGHPEWSHYAVRLKSGEAPGHLPIVFALHSVLYRVPLASALLTYAWLEWKAGHRAIGIGESAGVAEDPPPLFFEAQKQIPRLIQGGNRADDTPGFRVV